MQNKVAIITGGATGIGRATAEALAASGACVVIAGRNSARGEAAAEAIRRSGGDARYIRTDVCVEADVEALVQQTVEVYGGLDYLFNNAGTEGGVGPLTDETEQSVDSVLAANVKGVFLGMKHAIPALLARGGGAIVNTASFVGTVAPVPTAVIYGASKAAVLSMTASAAAGLADHGVHVYAVCPWVTDTPMLDRLTGGQEAFKEQFGGFNPSGVRAMPEDIAGVVVRLLAGTAGVESGGGVLVDRGGATTMLASTYAFLPAAPQTV